MSTETKTVADLELNDEHITAGLSDTLQEAARRLLTVPGGILIVLDDESKVKGIIGYKQLLLAIDKEIDTKTATCAEHMEMDYMEIRLHEDLVDVLKNIRKRSPQAVVAVDDNGDFSGYFSPSDYQESRAMVKSLKRLKL
tara:strand:- start:1116 stop:1535 length:420 start_codon:yes stop_codon:yes gene_type:complete